MKGGELREINMTMSSPSTWMHNQKRSDKLSRARTSALNDTTQSRRLHEPTCRISNIDPITGNDIPDAITHPSLVDGNLTIFFETEDTRKA
jgi:hypothetical protein